MTQQHSYTEQGRLLCRPLLYFSRGHHGRWPLGMAGMLFCLYATDGKIEIQPASWQKSQREKGPSMLHPRVWTTHLRLFLGTVHCKQRPTVLQLNVNTVSIWREEETKVVSKVKNGLFFPDSSYGRARESWYFFNTIIKRLILSNCSVSQCPFILMQKHFWGKNIQTHNNIIRRQLRQMGQCKKNTSRQKPFRVMEGPETSCRSTQVQLWLWQCERKWLQGDMEEFPVITPIFCHRCPECRVLEHTFLSQDFCLLPFSQQN
jgi:hypothetical protein